MVLGIVEYTFNNWNVSVNDGTLTFKCKLKNEDGEDVKLVRKYYIPRKAWKISFEGEYICIIDGDITAQFKLEGDSCIVGDKFKDGIHNDTIAAHDFYDEL